MRQFINNEKKRFLEFVDSSKTLIGITLFFIILSYGIKIFYLDYSIDTEVILDRYGEQMADWLKVDRLGLVFTKYLLFHHRFNPFVANFLTFSTFAVVSFLLCYLVQRVLENHSKKNALIIISILFLTHPIFAEQFNFTLQNFEVSLAILFQVISFFFVFYYIQTNNKIFVLPPILLTSWSFLTYQSMYTFFITGSIVSFILVFYRDQKDNQIKDVKEYFKIIFKYFFIFILSFVLSQIIAYVYTKAVHVPNTTYLTRQILWGKQPALQIVGNILNQIYYVVFAKSIFYNYGFLFSLVMVIIILFRKILSKSKMIYLEIFCVAALYISPFLLTILLGQGEPIRAQMPALEFVIAFNYYYVYLHLNNKVLQKLLVLLCLIIAFNQSYKTANLFFSEHMKFEEDTTLANRINVQLDNMGIGDRSQYSLIILGKHEPENIITFQGETLGHSFFAWDIGTLPGTSVRAVGFMRTLGYPFKLPTDQELNYAHSIEKNMAVWPSKNSIKIVKHVVIIKLSK